MNSTETTQRAIGLETTAFHTQPFALAAGKGKSPMLVALWNHANGRLIQTWVSVSAPVKE